jgi:hypothetical protein
MTLFEMGQLIGPAVAVYVAIRVDMAAMKIRLDHLERDLYKHREVNQQP